MSTKSTLWDGWIRIRGAGFRDFKVYYFVARNPLATAERTNMAAPEDFITDNCGIRCRRP